MHLRLLSNRAAGDALNYSDSENRPRKQSAASSSSSHDRGRRHPDRRERRRLRDPYIDSATEDDEYADAGSRSRHHHSHSHSQQRQQQRRHVSYRGGYGDETDDGLQYESYSTREVRRHVT